MDIETGLRDDQGYSSRGVVARIEEIGQLQYGLLVVPIYKYITLDLGKGNKSQAVKFVSPAPRVINDLTGEEYLDLNAVELGQIVVSPGLLYEKIEWTTALHAEHLKALQTYQRKDILIVDKSQAKEDAIDGGSINMATDMTTKNAVHQHLISKTKH